MEETFDLDLFEASSHINGNRYWYAHDFMKSLGYESWTAFKNIINKAIGSCTQLGVDVTESFVQCQELIDGKSIQSFKLSRFACFLITMQADPKKPEVSKAKIALAAIADALIVQHIKEDSLARIETREDLKAGEKIMSAVAQGAGLDTKYFGVFKDAGYRGMYNMSLKELKRYKGMQDPKSVLYDYMGLTELAGNLFRVTQTSERIKKKGVKGLDALNETAKQVGREVRQMMIDNAEEAPEEIPLESNIGEEKKKLKTAHKKMKQLDKPN